MEVRPKKAHTLSEHIAARMSAELGQCASDGRCKMECEQNKLSIALELNNLRGEMYTTSAHLRLLFYFM